MSLYHLSVFIHIISAICWMGGMLFTVLVLVPVSRDSLLRERRGAFFALVGYRFSRISWFLFVILTLTGITNLLLRGYALPDLFSAAFWRSGFGETLSYKLGTFGLALAVSGVHDFHAGPRAAVLMDEQPDSSAARRMRALSAWLGRINLLLGLAIIYFAMRLMRG